RDRHELVDQVADPVGWQPERADGGDDVLPLLDVVRTLDIHDEVEAPTEPLAVVRDVGEPVGWLTGGLHDHAILRAADAGEAEPDGALPLVGEPPLTESGQRLFDLAVGVE